MDGRGLIVGVDGGNSKTDALVARRDGTVLAGARVYGCADIYQADSPDAALALVTRAIEEARGRGADDRPVDVAVFSMAGADWPEDMTFLEEQLAKRDVATRVRVVNDGIGALWAGLPDGVGVVVASGTGTATGARGPDGTTWHSSFWQGPHGANDLGHRALSAAYRCELGIDPPTSLTRRLPEALGLRDLEAVLHAMTARGVKRPRVDSLAPVLLDEAEAGDPGAVQVVREHGGALGDWALAAARRVGIDLAEPFVLVMTGGVFRHPGQVLRQALVERVRDAAPQVVAREDKHAPVIGALRLAFEDAGLESPETFARIEATVPVEERPGATAPSAR